MPDKFVVTQYFSVLKIIRNHKNYHKQQLQPESKVLTVNAFLQRYFNQFAFHFLFHGVELLLIAFIVCVRQRYRSVPLPTGHKLSDRQKCCFIHTMKRISFDSSLEYNAVPAHPRTNSIMSPRCTFGKCFNNSYCSLPSVGPGFKACIR